MHEEQLPASIPLQFRVTEWMQAHQEDSVGEAHARKVVDRPLALSVEHAAPQVKFAPIVDPANVVVRVSAYDRVLLHMYLFLALTSESFHYYMLLKYFLEKRYDAHHSYHAPQMIHTIAWSVDKFLPPLNSR
ncbi:hypothetical protein ACHAWC_011350 [Mediolabrus comicus]